jgi:beta-lactam-binding protein with PASTA domain
VLATDPAPGTEVTHGQQITLLVGKPKAEEESSDNGKGPP